MEWHLWSTERKCCYLPGILYNMKISFRSESKTDFLRLTNKVCVSCTPAQQKMLRKVLQAENVWYQWYQKYLSGSVQTSDECWNS